MRVVIINGIAGSGKDTFVAMCKDVLGANRILNISTVDYVKEVAQFCGWDGTKTPENRKFLSDLKRILTEWNETPLKKVCEEVECWQDIWRVSGDYDNAVVFIHCREPKEIDKLVYQFNQYEPVTLMVRRSAAESVEQINSSDNSVFDYAYDYTVYNDSNLSWLHGEARAFLQNYLKLDI
jgi:hypothetical protein